MLKSQVKRECVKRLSTHFPNTLTQTSYSNWLPKGPFGTICYHSGHKYFKIVFAKGAPVISKINLNSLGAPTPYKNIQLELLNLYIFIFIKNLTVFLLFKRL